MNYKEIYLIKLEEHKDLLERHIKTLEQNEKLKETIVYLLNTIENARKIIKESQIKTNSDIARLQIANCHISKL